MKRFDDLNRKFLRDQSCFAIDVHFAKSDCAFTPASARDGRSTNWEKPMFRTMLVAVALLTALTSARADFVTYDISVPNAALSSLPQPFGTLTVTFVDSNTAHIKLTGNTFGTTQYLFSGNTTLALNVNAATMSGSSFSSHQPSDPFFAGATFADGGAVNNLSIFGDFNYSVDQTKNPQGRKAAVDTLEFDLDRTDGGTWANAASVLTANADGFSVGVHVFQFDTTDYSSSSTQLVTGFAGDGKVVPEPSSMALLFSGAGFMGLFGVRRFRRKSA